MERYFAFLRAINVGGRTVTMSALRGHLQALGLEKVQTFIASGNVIFETECQDQAALEARIEAHLAQVLGFEVATFVVTGPELRAIIEHPAFSEEEMDAAQAYNIALMKAPLSTEAFARLKALENEQDGFASQGRAFYWLCRSKQSQSGFDNRRFERVARVQGTFRSISSLKRLAKKYELQDDH
ncbi:DUF1697 domain-containing protein [Gallaecimonas sp. GXIMD4217]|uniref:DUF1697 domain-containing protein n=1 Tax=Gallaecimonas sp. GXIMD4217 TaxID=3131927 RepID=UPI00311B1A58